MSETFFVIFRRENLSILTNIVLIYLNIELLYNYNKNGELI